MRNSPGGTVCMEITHTINGGWNVDATSCGGDQDWGEGNYVGGAAPIAVNDVKF